MSSTSQLTTFNDLFVDLQNRCRVTTGVSATETQAKRYINIALHDFNLGFQYKLPWLERTAQLRTHAPYSTGTVAISVGSNTLTGTSTLWSTADSYGENNARTTGKMTLQGTPDIIYEGLANGANFIDERSFGAEYSGPRRVMGGLAVTTLGSGKLYIYLA